MPMTNSSNYYCGEKINVIKRTWCCLPNQTNLYCIIAFYSQSISRLIFSPYLIYSSIKNYSSTVVFSQLTVPMIYLNFISTLLISNLNPFVSSFLMYLLTNLAIFFCLKNVKPIIISILCFHLIFLDKFFVYVLCCFILDRKLYLQKRSTYAYLVSSRFFLQYISNCLYSVAELLAVLHCLEF